MSGPTVTATIAVDDKASPAMKEFAALAKRIAQETAAELKGTNGDALANSFKRANSAAKEHLSTLQNIKKMHSEIAMIAGGVMASRTAQDIKAKVLDYGKYDKEVRLQQLASTDNSKPGGKFDNADMDMLNAQRVDAARNRNVPVDESLHAQNEFVKRQFNADMVKEGTNWAITVSKALDISADKAAQLIEAMVFVQGEKIESVSALHEKMKEASDRAVIMMKKGALDPEDIQQNTKLSGGMAAVAHVSPLTNSAIAMTLMRAKISGEESGVFQRQLYARLLSPTKEGLTNLEAAGIHYDDYTNHQSISPEAVSENQKRRFGKGLSPAAMEGLRAQIDDKDSKIMDSQEAFSSAVLKAVEQSDGKVSKTDQKHLVSAANDQYKAARTNLQGDKLLSEMLAKMSPEQLLGFLGVKQGAKFDMLKLALDAYKNNREELANNAGIAPQIANERQKGLGASLDNLSSASDNAAKNLVKVASVPLEAGVRGLTSIINTLDALPDNVKATAVTAGLTGLGAAAVGSVAGVISLGASAAAAATSLNLLATRGLPTGALPIGKGLAGAAAEGAPAVATVGSRMSGVLGLVSKAFWVATIAQLTAMGVEMLYDTTLSDKATGFDRNNSPEHARAETYKQAIKREADERMRNELERQGRDANEFATQGDARVRGAMPSMYDPDNNRMITPANSVNPWGDNHTSTAAEVTGSITGTADVNTRVTIEPSPWFVAKMGAIEKGVMMLQGKIGGDKVGTGLGGSQGAQPVATGASGSW